MYCSRYKKNCNEAIYLNCDVPSNSSQNDEQMLECKECVFCEVENERIRELD